MSSPAPANPAPAGTNPAPAETNRAPVSGDFFTARNLLSFLLVAIIWGSTWLVIKDQVGTVPPGWSVTWRFALGGVAMFALARFRGESLWLNREGMKLAAILALTQFVLNFQFVYSAEIHLTSGIVAVLYALLLVPNALLARLFLKQPISRGFAGGSAIAIAGIVLLLIHEYRIAPPEGQIALGIALTLCGIACASAANVLQATQAARRQPLLPLLAWAMLLGSAGDAVFSWIVSGPPVFEMRWGYAAGIAYLGIVGSVLTFPIYFRLIRDLGPGRAAYNGVIVPIIAMLLSTLFEGYRWSLLAAAGGVLALAGLVVALKARSPSR